MNRFDVYCFPHVKLFEFLFLRLHTDVIQFFDEYVTGRADFIRQNELNREAAEFNKHQIEERHHVRLHFYFSVFKPDLFNKLIFQEELTNHKNELLNVTNQYLNSQVTFWTKKQDEPISLYHESWLTNYKTRH